MSDRMITLASGAIVNVIERWRCPDCGTWIGEATVGHTSFARLAANRRVCTGRAGTGRKRTQYLSTMPTEKQREQIDTRYGGHPEFHPMLQWRTATRSEIQEVKSGASPQLETT